MNMDNCDLVATISGAALSLLFYENACSVGDQMGFLLGDVVMFVTKNVTDSERQVESVKRHIEITSVLTCSSLGQLCDETGKLNKEKLHAFAQDRSKEIVGWFRFRHNNRPVPTFRDKILHKELAKYFQESNGQASKEYFVACMLCATKTEKKGTHKFRHVLLRYEDGTYRPVPLRINNLGANMNRHDGSDYMPTPANRTLQEPDVFTKLVRSLELDIHHTSGNELVTTIQKAAEQYVKSLIPKVCNSDREIFEMEKQLQELRLKIISKVMDPKGFVMDNQRMSETNHRDALSMTGDCSINMEIREETPSRTPNVYSDHYVDKESTFSKTKGPVMRPTNAINIIHSPIDSAQKSPSSRFNNSQSSRRSTDSEDIFDASNC